MASNRAGVETRKKILRTVSAVLAERGLEGLTIAAVCDRAGIQVGSFYHQFPSKEEAVLEVVRGAIGAVDPDPDQAGAETLEDLTSAYVAFVTGEPHLARVYVRLGVVGGLGDGPTAAAFLSHHRRRVERFAAAMEREHDLEEKEAGQRAELMLAALNGLAVGWLLDPTVDIEGLAHRALLVAGPPS